MGGTPDIVQSATQAEMVLNLQGRNDSSQDRGPAVFSTISTCAQCKTKSTAGIVVLIAMKKAINQAR